MDIGRQPAWPRIWGELFLKIIFLNVNWLIFNSFTETYGEDVLLGQKLGESFIKGQQGNDMTNKTKVASCLKHYIGYGLPANGMNTF
jgi:beta-glucosidase